MSAQPPDGYVEAIQVMAQAAQAWIRAHPFACLVLEPLDPDKLPIDAAARAELRAVMARSPDKDPNVIVNLRDAVEWWGGNEPTRELLRAMDRAAGGRRPTYMMARCALELYVFPKSEASA